MTNLSSVNSNPGIAIVGMAGRFPGAPNLAAFWQNLRQGVESIDFFTPEELTAAGVDPVTLNQPNYVRARSTLPGVELFDAEFFGYTPHEAAHMDPQQRIFLETAWAALEDAGYDATRYDGAIGLFAGSSLSRYLLANLCSGRGYIEGFLSRKQVGAFQTFLGNDKDSLTTRAAYKLNLKGPVVTVQTACSTSLVAVVMAYQSLLTFQADLALAGGVTVTFPQRCGYAYTEGGIASPDGHCRAFDARAQGTVFGSGVGLVVMKRLAEALEDGDHIYAVIKGAALNNDGADKVSYTAPSVNGQAAAIVTAQTVGGISPDTISYVEAHGTGTALGDPIEISALTQAFRTGTSRNQFCALGSVKTNIGHVDAAAGVAGLIKTTLALQHREIPASLNFEQPNPKIDFANSPFYVNARLAEWRVEDGVPRRAAVSSFGVGGTNAHVVLEEAPPVAPATPARPWQLLLLSARSETALEQAAAQLREFLVQNPDANLADVAFTLATGRREFNHRRVLVARDVGDAIALLEKPEPRRVFGGLQDRSSPPVVMMFPGQGAQHLQMGAELYAREPVFQEVVDNCARLLEPELGNDVREILFLDSTQTEKAAALLGQTRFAQPALFTIEYALAQLWFSWGIRPTTLIGHSLGEYVAACLAGVFSLEDALRLVARRAALMQARPPGAMLAVRKSEQDLRPLLGNRLDIAAINAAELTVVSGAEDAIGELESTLRTQGAATKRLATSHAFHSAMMDPVMDALRAEVSRVTLQPPEISCISNVTGRHLTTAEAVDPDYWARHLRQPVRFADGIAEVLTDPEAVLLEVGPGTTLSALARQSDRASGGHVSVTSMPGGPQGEAAAMLVGLGQLWVAGATPDWAEFYGNDARRRLSLPTYPFERQRHFIEPPPPVSATAKVEVGVSENDPIAPAPLELSETPPLAMIPGPPGPGAVLNNSNSPSRASGELAPQRSQAVPAAAGGPGRQSRRERILHDVETLLRDLSGVHLTAADRSRSFLELGFDSLFLTQARQRFQTTFNVRLTYRQLVEQVSTIDALVDHLVQQLPPEAYPPELDATADGNSAPPPQLASVAAPVPVAAAGNSAPAVERLMAQQVEAMSQLFAQQLAVLRAGEQEWPAPACALTPALAAPSGKAPPPINSSQNASPVQPAAGELAVDDPKVDGRKPFGPYRPVVARREENLTAKQRAYLQAFTSRFTARTAGSKRLAQATRAAVADPRSIANFRQDWKELVYQIAVDRSEGAYLWDVDGNRYVDFTMGFGVNLLGHRPAAVMEALTQQLSRGTPIGPQSPLVGEVADLIRESTGMERVTFCNTGSEAVMAALRVARTVTQRKLIVYFSGDYHGLFDEVLQRSPSGAGSAPAVPVAPGIPPEAGENVRVLGYGTPEALAFIREHGRELAAVLVEPVQSRNPTLQPRAFLQELREITRDSGTALIMDEMITGFRVHPRGAQGWFNVQGDLATYGKVVGGGLPIGVLAGSAKYLDALDGGNWEFGDDSGPEADITFFAGTFVRHPLALAAARATLRHLKASGPTLQTELNQRTDHLVGRLKRVFEEAGVPVGVHHFGSLFRFHFPADLPNAALLIYGLLDRHIYIRDTHQNCFLSTAHSEADLDRLVVAVQETVADLQAADFFPGRARNAGPTVAPPHPISETKESPSPFPLTEAQREIWLGCQMSVEASCAFNESLTLTLRGPLNVAVLSAAVQAVVSRHDALRLTVAADGATQAVKADVRMELPLEDWSEFDASTRAERVAGIALQESAQPFDLASGPLVRARLCRLAPDHHLLVFTAHHIVCDGWSVGVIFKELGQLYSAGLTGSPGRLPTAETFRDYALTRESSAAQEVAAKAESYWVEQFHTVPPGLELPTDHPRRNQSIRAAGHHRVALDAGLIAAMKQTASRQGCTFFATLLATYQVLLHRLSGQDDLAVGIAAAGQAGGGHDSLVGHAVTLLPIRTRLDADAPFGQFLKGLNRRLLDAQEHAECSFGRLLQALKLPRLEGRMPLLSAIFNLNRSVADSLRFDGLETSFAPNPHGVTNFDLYFNLREIGGTVWVDVEYNRDLFGAATIARWVGHYETLLRSVATAPETPVSELPLLSEEERRHLLMLGENMSDAKSRPGGDERPAALAHATLAQEGRCNCAADTAGISTLAGEPDAVGSSQSGRLPSLRTGDGRELTISEQVEVQVARDPSAVAVRYGDRLLTYGELNTRANQLAHRLRRNGLQPDDIVALCLERSPELIVALLGIVKAGGAYLSLDPSYPRERLAFMLADSEATALLTTEALRPTTGALTGSKAAAKLEVICLDADWAGIAREPETNLKATATGENLIYVSYTSGSTGRPKGVCIPQRAVNRLLIDTDYIELQSTDVMLQISNCAFDASTFEIWGALLHGAQLVILPSEVVLAPAEFARELERRGITVMFLTTALFNQLAPRASELFPRVRHLFVGGEAANPECFREVLRTGRPGRLIHVYGPTETTTYATWYEVKDVPADATTVPIGGPLAHTVVRVLDNHRQLVPIGVPGELYIGGERLARGYLHQPELTAQKFVPDPFAPAAEGEGAPTARLYRTGDRVRWRPDGVLEFLGRIDQQVKIRGFRIELEEIEGALEQHPAVKQAVVVAPVGADGDRRLTAYLTSGDKAPAVPLLREFLRRTLPDYMVPSAFIFVDTFPLNANGKVDRGALPDPGFDRASTAVHSVGPAGPQDEVEEQLAAIWERVLQVRTVGRNDNFFDLGGHSLAGIRLFAAIEQEFGRKLPLGSLFQAPTIAQLGGLLRETPASTRREETTKRSSLVTLQAGGGRPPLFFVHGAGTGNLWTYANLLPHLEPDQPVYAFESQAAAGGEEFDSIEAMAGGYLVELRRVQPEGPYLLGGYCFGGNVAYEMACQLEESGERVALLALLDSSPSSGSYNRIPWWPPGYAVRFSVNAARWFSDFLALPGEERWKLIRRKLRAARRRFLRRVKAQPAGNLDLEAIVDVSLYSERELEVWRTHINASARHRPKPYSGRVVLLRTRGQPLFCSLDPQFGWGELAAGGVETILLPGAHENIFLEPNVSEVAARLTACMASATGQQAAPKPSDDRSEDRLELASPR